MHPYVSILLAACVVCCSYVAAVVLARPGRLGRRRKALIMLAPAYWAFCQLLWNLAPSPDVALGYARLSSPGWAVLCPAAVHLLSGLSSARGAALLRPALGPLYGLAALVTLRTWASPHVIENMVPTHWGYGYEVGPEFTAYAVFSALCVGLALLVHLREPATPRQSDDRTRVALAVAIPTVVVLLSDGLLPGFGIQLPYLGTSAFAMVALHNLWFNVRQASPQASSGAFSQEMLKILHDGVALVSEDGRLRVANRGTEELTGLSARQLRGKPLEQFVPSFEVERAGELLDFECELEPHRGQAVPISLSSSRLVDARGVTSGFVVAIRDLREVVLLKNRLVTSGRLAAVGQLAAGIAHEINNPLAYVRANLSLLREHWEAIVKDVEKLPVDEGISDLMGEGEELIDESLEGVDRAVRIVRDVREFSHAGRQERELTDLNQVLDRVLRVAMPKLGQGVAIQKHPGELPLIFSSPQRLNQVFLNLIVNALHAVGEKGMVVLSTRVEEDQALVSIDDDGCGIPKEDLERIFDPFFTTKPVGEGTGLGLSISYEIIRSLGGDIEVDSVVGYGTRVCVRLPLTTE